MQTVEVYRAANALQANLLQATLSEAGIRSQVVGEFLQGGLGDLPLGWPTSPRILVGADDEAAARELIVDWEARAGTASQDDDVLPEDLAAEFGSGDESASASPRE